MEMEMELETELQTWNGRQTRKWSLTSTGYHSRSRPTCIAASMAESAPRWEPIQLHPGLCTKVASQPPPQVELLEYDIKLMRTGHNYTFQGILPISQSVHFASHHLSCL